MANRSVDRCGHAGQHVGGGLPVEPRSILPPSWPINLSITRDGMAASCSHVANVRRKSCGPRSSRCSSRSAESLVLVGLVDRGLVDAAVVVGGQAAAGAPAGVAIAAWAREREGVRIGHAG
jgi:hypothetical protein